MLYMQTLFEYMVYISEVVGNTAKFVNRTYKVLLDTFFLIIMLLDTWTWFSN